MKLHLDLIDIPGLWIFGGLVAKILMATRFG
jgi:hypothetical protein